MPHRLRHLDAFDVSDYEELRAHAIADVVELLRLEMEPAKRFRNRVPPLPDSIVALVGTAFCFRDQRPKLNVGIDQR